MRLPRLLTAAIRTQLLRRVANARTSDFEVVRGDDRQVYLRRWWVIPRNNRFNIYLHNMLRSDDPILHDHMYWSFSVILTDGIRERWVEDPQGMRDKELPYHEGEPVRLKLENYARERTFHEGDLVLRSAEMAHQLIIEEGEPAWTLFITGPRIKDWGFYCPKGWRHWSKYVALGRDPSVKGNGAATTSGRGEGCGELE